MATRVEDYRMRLAASVAKAGAYLIDHADDIVGNLPPIANLQITLNFPGGGDEFPEIRIEHRVCSLEVVEAFLPKRAPDKEK